MGKLFIQKLLSILVLFYCHAGFSTQDTEAKKHQGWGWDWKWGYSSFVSALQ
jgi:hypothetical protein